MIRLARRTPVKLALGSPPREMVGTELTQPAATANPTGYGTCQRGTGTPVSLSEQGRATCEREIRVSQQIPASRSAAAPSTMHSPVATSRTSIRFRVQSIMAGSTRAKIQDQSRRRRESSIARPDRHGRDWRPRPATLLGPERTHTARPGASSDNTARPASLQKSRCSHRWGHLILALVKMLSVLVCRTRSAPAASAASSTLIVPAIVHFLELARDRRTQGWDLPPGGRPSCAPDQAGARRNPIANVGEDRTSAASGRWPTAAPGRSTTRTCWPESTNWLTRWLPMNPAPPVTIVNSPMSE